MKKTTKKSVKKNTSSTSKRKEKNWQKFWKLGNPDWNTHYFDVSQEGELIVSEGAYAYNVCKLIQKYNTPLKVIFPSIIQSRLKDLIGYFESYIEVYGYKGSFSYHYPMKVNQSKEFVMTVLSAGANLEVTSENELWLVQKLWEKEKLDKKIKIFCNGPKTEKYLNLINQLYKKGIDIVPIIEGPEEVTPLTSYKGDIGVRIDLNVKADTHWDNKFDRFGLSEKEVLSLPKIKNLKVMHYHLGSQIKTQKSILEGVRYGFDFYKRLKKNQPNLETLDIGGGISVPYQKKDFYTGKKVVGRIVKLLKTLSEKSKVKPPNIVVEWGQYIVAPAQVTLYKVISEKPIPKANAQSWYIVDGSFINDLPDTWAIHQKWYAIPANNMKKGLKRVWLAGSTCDSDDKYTQGGSYIKLPKLEKGKDQYVAILDTGAYQDSLSSFHCLLASPTKVVARDGVVKKIHSREKPETIAKFFGWPNGVEK